MKQWLPVVGASLASAALFVLAPFGSLGGILLAYLTALPLFLVGLSLGWMASAIAGFGGAVLIGLEAGFTGGLMFLLLFGGPVAFLVQRALLSRPEGDDPASGRIEWYPTGYLILWLAGMAVALVALMAALASGVEGGLRGMVAQTVDELVGTIATTPPEDRAVGTEVQLFRDTLVQYGPGVFALSWALMLMVNAALAQGVLAGRGAALRPSPSLSRIDFPRWAPFALAGIALLGVTDFLGFGYLAVNMTMIAALPFLMGGLGVVHSATAALPGRMLVLTGIYLLVLVLPFVQSAMVLIGLADHWFGIRGRIWPQGQPPVGGKSGGDRNAANDDDRDD